MNPVQQLVATALSGPDGDRLMALAEHAATTARDRQLVVIAAAFRRGEQERVDALVRDHLVDHPDDVLVAWIASQNKERP